MSEPMTLERLAEIEARAQNASPGPWRWDAVDPKDDNVGRLCGFGLEFLELVSPIGLCVLRPMDNMLIVEPCDKEFIEDAQVDMRDLTKELRRLQQRERELLTLIALENGWLMFMPTGTVETILQVDTIDAIWEKRDAAAREGVHLVKAAVDSERAH